MSRQSTSDRLIREVSRCVAIAAVASEEIAALLIDDAIRLSARAKPAEPADVSLCNGTPVPSRYDHDVPIACRTMVAELA